MGSRPGWLGHESLPTGHPKVAEASIYCEGYTKVRICAVKEVGLHGITYWSIFNQIVVVVVVAGIPLECVHES